MNRVLLQKIQKIEENLFEVASQEKRDHLTKHLKVREGDKIKVAVESEGLGFATVEKIKDHGLILRVSELTSAKKQPYSLLVGASRPPTMKKILEHGTCLGVKKFIFFPAKLSEKSYLKSKIYEEQFLNELLILGIEQSGSFCELPSVEIANNLEAALERVESKNRFLLSLNSKKFLNSTIEKDCSVTVAIGPERGWTLDEERDLENSQFQPVQISTNILRVEIATFVALGQLEYLFQNTV